MKTLYFIILFIWATNCASQGLKVGEKIPDLVVGDIIYPTNMTSFNLHSLKNKIIIFDYWATNCSACIESFPKLDSLQKKYGKDVQIVLFALQNQKIIKEFFAKRKRLKMPEVIIVASAGSLYNLFPRRTAPYLVWVNRDLTITSISNGVNLNDITLRRIIRGEQVEMVQIPEINVLKFKTSLNNDLASVTKSFTSLTGYSDELKTRNLNGAVIGNKVHISQFRASIEELIQLAYSEGKGVFFKHNFVLDVDDTFRYRKPSGLAYLDWVAKYSYTYELQLDTSLKDRAYKIMQKQLSDLFNVNLKIESRLVNCYVLKFNGDSLAIKSKGGKKVVRLNLDNPKQPYEDSVHLVLNAPFSHFTNKLQGIIRWNKELELVDETGIFFNVDMFLDVQSLNKIDFKQLESDLKRYGLSLSLEKRWLPMFVLSQSKKPAEPAENITSFFR